MTLAYRSLLIFLFAGLAAISVFGQVDQGNSSETKWYGHPVTGDYISGELDKLAVQYKEYAPIPKMAIYDIGYPKDSKEFESLDGYGLILVAAVSQTKEELPIKRIYILTGGKEVNLTRMHMYLSNAEDPSSQTFKTLGGFRMDAIFAFPVYLRLQPGLVYVEFAKDTKPMTLAKFNGETPNSLVRLPNRRPAGTDYPSMALRTFMKREYPGYFPN